MINKFAQAVSFLLGPIFILLPIPFILVERFSGSYYYALKWTIFSYAFILSVALFVVLGVMFGFFTNFNVSKREQRPLLFSFSAFVMFFYLISLFVLDAPKILFVALFAIVLGLVAIVVINRWVKASIHLATLTSVALFIGIIYKGPYFLLLFLIPLLAWSRVRVKGHTLTETAVGAILGALITIFVYTMSRQFLLGIIYD